MHFENNNLNIYNKYIMHLISIIMVYEDAFNSILFIYIINSKHIFKYQSY